MTRADQRRRLWAAAGAWQAPGDPLAIVEVKAWRLREPGSGRRYAVLRLRSASGLAGFGECRELTADDMALAAERLKDLPATAVEALARLLRERPGLNAAVNMAALDVAARFAKVPLFQYLGGPTRYKARAMTRVENAERMKAAMAAGYRAFLVRMPVEELRKAAGEGVDFVVEGSGGLAAAADVCRRLEKFHPYWFDEPCPATNLPAAKRLASESVTPLGFGRGLDEPAQFEDLLREEAVDVLRPALDRHGISGIRKLAAMAETRYAVVAPYHDGGPVGSAAALHLAASLPNFFIQQVPFPAAEADRAMRAALGGGEQPVEGFLPLPEGAGLGVAPDEATLARLAGAGGG